MQSEQYKNFFFKNIPLFFKPLDIKTFYTFTRGDILNGHNELLEFMKRHNIPTIDKASKILGYSARINTSQRNLALIQKIKEYESNLIITPIKQHNKNVGISDETKLRKCLKCDNNFVSKSTINRLCIHCKEEKLERFNYDKKGYSTGRAYTLNQGIEREI